ncbi:MAG: hypothetical protein RMK29_12340 [Myxococcales bacterium]|nr:hypothetical protein [Myxococcota bacterium]MDW8282494.1 hypothetical protein [Myxococcales bacterium]
MAYENGRRLLERISNDPMLAPLREDAEARHLVEQLRQEVAVLAMAPTLRIGAARRLQGVASRRRTAAHALFAACAEIRRRVKLRYRGPRHQTLRRAFGEGMPASPAKPETVLQFAQQILSAAPHYSSQLREVRVRAPTLQRVANLQKGLRACTPERLELRTARRQISDTLAQTATRANALCAALIALARRLCPGDDVSTLLPPGQVPKPARSARRS